MKVLEKVSWRVEKAFYHFFLVFTEVFNKIPDLTSKSELDSWITAVLLLPFNFGWEMFYITVLCHVFNWEKRHYFAPPLSPEIFWPIKMITLHYTLILDMQWNISTDCLSSKQLKGDDWNDILLPFLITSICPISIPLFIGTSEKQKNEPWKSFLDLDSQKRAAHKSNPTHYTGLLGSKNTYWLLDQYFESIDVLLWDVDLVGSGKAYLHVKQFCKKKKKKVAVLISYFPPNIYE